MLLYKCFMFILFENYIGIVYKFLDNIIDIVFLYMAMTCVIVKKTKTEGSISE